MSDEKAIEWVAINIRAACEAAGLLVVSADDDTFADADEALTEAGYDDDDGDDGKLSIVSRIRNLVYDLEEARTAGPDAVVRRERDAAIARAEKAEAERDEARAIARRWHEFADMTHRQSWQDDDKTVASWPEVNP